MRFLEQLPRHGRQCRCQHTWVPDGRVICLPGDVRSHVAADQLAEWAERLALASIRLELLCGESRECRPDANAMASINAHLTQQAETIEQLSAEWEATRQEKATLDSQIRFEAQRGCGLRLHKLDVRPQFREGDIIYHPPPPDRSTQPGVAVVFSVCRAHGYGGAGRWPTGELDIMWWDLRRLAFRKLERSVPDRSFTLFPPCCGRGAACKHLLLAQIGCWQWPNGDELDLRVLRPIPEVCAHTPQHARTHHSTHTCMTGCTHAPRLSLAS